jgi:acyl carrier protein
VYREAWHEYRQGAADRPLSEGRRVVEELWADVSPSDDDLVSRLPLDSLARLELTDLVEAVTGTDPEEDAFDTMTVGHLRALLDAHA